MIVSRTHRFRRSPVPAALVFAAALVPALVAPTADALPVADCGSRYANCVDRASQLNDYWARSKAGADCAWSFVICVASASWW